MPRSMASAQHLGPGGFAHLGVLAPPAELEHVEVAPGRPAAVGGAVGLFVPVRLGGVAEIIEHGVAEVLRAVGGRPGSIRSSWNWWVSAKLTANCQACAASSCPTAATAAAVYSGSRIQRGGVTASGS